MTVYIWQILSMPSYSQIDGQSDVVFQVNWQCAAKDDIYGVTSNGSVPVSYTAGSPFTPYADLTENQVWGWVNPSIDRPKIEANLQAMIDEQKNPPVVIPPLPWSD
jgi:hypothetical protein